MCFQPNKWNVQIYVNIKGNNKKGVSITIIEKEFLFTTFRMLNNQSTNDTPIQIKICQFILAKWLTQLYPLRFCQHVYVKPIYYRQTSCEFIGHDAICANLFYMYVISGYYTLAFTKFMYLYSFPKKQFYKKKLKPKSLRNII